MEQKSNSKVGIFIPCLIDQFAPQTAHNLTKLLSFLGVNYHYPQQQSCCGRLLYENGDYDNARRIGRHLLEAYADDKLVVYCGMGCTHYMQHHFKPLYDNSSYRQAATELAAKSIDIADYLANILHYTPQGTRFPHRVAWLDHCALEYDDKQYTSPRKLLNALSDISLTEIPQNYIGGGHNDLFGTHFPALTATLIQRQVQEALSAEVEYLVTAEATALVRLQAYCTKQALPVKCLHLVDLLCLTLNETQQ